MTRAQRTARGETLLEAMITLAVFSIGILGVLSATVLAHKQNGLAAHETRSSNIARDLIDDFQRLPYTHSALSTGATHRITETANLGDGVNRPLLGAAQQILAVDGNGATGTGGTYDVSWVVTADVDASGVEQGKRIEIDVTYKAGNYSHALVFWSYKYNPSALAGETGTFEEI